MHVIEARNVQEALPRGVRYLLRAGQREPSRDGPVLVAPEPVTTVYERPWERVLLDPVRDANPFFHLMESVWILAGRNDPQWLDRYVRNFSARFAEADGRQHGAYGYRWRWHFSRYRDGSEPIDQLTQVAEMIRTDPTTRRAVLTMWDPRVDLNLPSRDLPCNTHVYFRARRSDIVAGIPHYVLDITVCCRSNDAVMGAYGANAVHMSIMGEVVAGLAGMRSGIYRQVSNNFHVYERDIEKASTDWTWTRYDQCHPGWEREGIIAQPICGEDDAPAALQREAELVMSDCRAFVESIDSDNFETLSKYAKSRWFRETVVPMQLAHDLWRDGQRDAAYLTLSELVARSRSDWGRAGAEWMNRRIQK